jgi:hypothetical protein
MGRVLRIGIFQSRLNEHGMDLEMWKKEKDEVEARKKEKFDALLNRFLEQSLPPSSRWKPAERRRPENNSFATSV